MLDSYGAFLMGYTPEEIEYIRLGAEIGAGKSDISKADITELGTEMKRELKPAPASLDRPGFSGDSS